MNEWKRKRSIMRRYDLTAHIYDIRYAEEQAAKIKAALEKLTIEKSAFVLDVGCGTGILFDYVAEKVETVIGLDISRKILLQARKRAKNFQNVHLILADADNIPLREKIFTHVFGITLLQNMPNPARTLKEIKRVTRDGAYIIVTGLKKVFSLQTFENLLQNAGLKIVSLKEKDLKCYVAICLKFPRNCCVSANSYVEKFSVEL
ncbi:MAG: methyltransferase domain-containing protein [Candidatus Bathyarchaeia archaeon]